MKDAHQLDSVFFAIQRYIVLKDLLMPHIISGFAMFEKHDSCLKESMKICLWLYMRDAETNTNHTSIVSLSSVTPSTQTTITTKTFPSGLLQDYQK